MVTHTMGCSVMFLLIFLSLSNFIDPIEAWKLFKTSLHAGRPQLVSFSFEVGLLVLLTVWSSASWLYVIKRLRHNKLCIKCDEKRLLWWLIMKLKCPLFYCSICNGFRTAFSQLNSSDIANTENRETLMWTTDSSYLILLDEFGLNLVVL